jgi:hypothetical protein
MLIVVPGSPHSAIIAWKNGLISSIPLSVPSGVKSTALGE